MAEDTLWRNKKHWELMTEKNKGIADFSSNYCEEKST